MVVVILGMLVCLALAVVVLALVALPAHRDGESLFVEREPAVPEAAHGEALDAEAREHARA